MPPHQAQRLRLHAFSKGKDNKEKKKNLHKQKLSGKTEILSLFRLSIFRSGSWANRKSGGHRRRNSFSLSLKQILLPPLYKVAKELLLVSQTSFGVSEEVVKKYSIIRCNPVCASKELWPVLFDHFSRRNKKH